MALYITIKEVFMGEVKATGTVRFFGKDSRTGELVIFYSQEGAIPMDFPSELEKEFPYWEIFWDVINNCVSDQRRRQLQNLPEDYYRHFAEDVNFTTYWDFHPNYETDNKQQKLMDFLTGKTDIFGNILLYKNENYLNSERFYSQTEQLSLIPSLTPIEKKLITEKVEQYYGKSLPQVETKGNIYFSLQDCLFRKIGDKKQVVVKTLYAFIEKIKITYQRNRLLQFLYHLKSQFNGKYPYKPDLVIACSDVFRQVNGFASSDFLVFVVPDDWDFFVDFQIKLKQILVEILATRRKAAQQKTPSKTLFT